MKRFESQNSVLCFFLVHDSLFFSMHRIVQFTPDNDRGVAIRLQFVRLSDGKLSRKKKKKKKSKKK